MLRCAKCNRGIPISRALWRKHNGKSVAFCGQKHFREYITGGGAWRCLVLPIARMDYTQDDMESARLTLREENRIAGKPDAPLDEGKVREWAMDEAEVRAWYADGRPLLSPDGEVIRDDHPEWKDHYPEAARAD